MSVEILSLIVAILAILFMLFTVKAKIMPLSAGNDRMVQISNYIRNGAMTFLKREYKFIAIFVVIVAILLGIFINVKTMICYILGSVLSMLAGFIGMRVATASNVRCAN